MDKLVQWPAWPTRAYSVAQARELDQLASASFELPGSELMERAARAALRLIEQRFPNARKVLLVCGGGNNGGDGYVLARLLRERGVQAVVLGASSTTPSPSEAAAAQVAWRESGGTDLHFDGDLPSADLLVDALFGIGLNRAAEGGAAQLIAAMNRHDAPLLALDVPSGLDADTGIAHGEAVRADLCLSFIALKRGLLTGHAADYVGELLVDDLSLPAVLYACVPAAVEILQAASLAELLPRRRRSAHKGDFGHVLVVGGDEGYGGAVRLAAEAAARVGAGLVSVATRASHVAPILAARPELMVRGVSGPGDLQNLLDRADVVVVGPGLGRGAWAQTLLAAVTERGLPTVMDADALNLLAEAACVLPENVVLTPHPGEAARLLDCRVDEIGQDRYAAAERLAEYCQGTVVLKGAGSLVAERGRPVSVCPYANPGLASGGSGDVLAGCIGGLIAQGLSSSAAARMGVLIHAMAGAAAARDGERGMLAGDLLPQLRTVVNTHS